MLPLRWRLTLVHTGLLALTLLLFGYSLYHILEHRLLSGTDHLLAERAARIILRMGGGPGRAWQERGMPPGDLFAGAGVYFQLVAPSGEIIARSPNPGGEFLPVAPATLARAQQGSFFQTVITSEGKLRVYNLPIFRSGELVAVLQAAQSLEPISTLLSGLLELLLGLGVIVVAVAAGLSYALARAALAPVRRLTGVAAEISETGDLSRRVEHEGPRDEIGELAATFNAMLARLAATQERLEKTSAAQRRFVADVSHELRTPLTIIKGNLELLRQVGDVSGPQAEMLQDALSEADRMSRLLHNLLILARADAGQHIEKELLDIGSLVREVARQAGHLGAAAFQVLGLEALEGVRVLGSADYLKQLLFILLDNAFKYTPPSGTVTLAAGLEEGWCVLRVVDTGPGIPAAELPRVFERFFRGSAAKAGGTGLGLAIAKWIAAEHGGSLEVESEEGKGTTFTFRIPVLPPGAAEARTEEERVMRELPR